MSFFRKLFGGGEAPAPTEEEAPVARATGEPPPPPTMAAPLDDPYRGPAFVEADPADEIVVIGRPAPIWNWRGRVLALEANRRGPLPLRWAVYTGLSSETLILRKVSFGEGGYRIDWEHRTDFPDAYDNYVVRIGDRVVMPRDRGLVAFHLATGRPCWELPHPARLQSQPKLDAAGNLVLVFADQSWMVVAVRDGATVSEGVAQNDRDVEALTRGTSEIGKHLRNEVRYGNATVTLGRNEVRVRGGAVAAEDDPTAPTRGDYPLDGKWEGGDWTALAGGKLVLQLEHGFAGKKWAAIGLLDPTSLEALQLLELGEVTSGINGWVVDGLVVADTDLPERPDDVAFIVDPELERVVALFREDGAEGFLFDREGNRIWACPL